MAKNSIEAYGAEGKSNVLFFDPEKLTLVTDETSALYDPDRDAHLHKRGIRNVVSWAQTGRGGQTLDWIKVTGESKACESAYGLCE